MAAPTHASGYSNGREWLCTECYETLEPPDKAVECGQDVKRRKAVMSNSEQFGDCSANLP
jgi:hypothetical protein